MTTLRKSAYIWKFTQSDKHLLIMIIDNAYFSDI